MIECPRRRVLQLLYVGMAPTRAIYAILKQKPYNFTTNMLKVYLSAQASSLSCERKHEGLLPDCRVGMEESESEDVSG